MISGFNVLFLGGMIPRESDNAPIDLTAYGALDHAADVYQWNMINGIERHLGLPARIISAPFVSAVRGKATKHRVKGFDWHHGGSSHDVSVSFVNVLGIRNVTRELSVRRAIKQSLTARDETDEGRLVVLVYAMHGPFLQQLALIKGEDVGMLLAVFTAPASSLRIPGLSWVTTYTAPVVGSDARPPNSTPPLLVGTCTVSE